MEPMTLGSPVSPVAGSGGIAMPGVAAPAGTTTATPYLPSYLFGDSHQTTSNRVAVPGCSPGGTGGSSRHYGGAVGGLSSPSSPQPGAKDASTPVFPQPRFGGRGPSLGGGCERPSGPPVLGLGASPAASSPAGAARLQHGSSPFLDGGHRTPATMGRTPVGSPHTPLRPLHTPHGVLTPHAHHTPYGSHTPHALNASIISTEVHGEVSSSGSVSGLLDVWVTVFGFPVASASYILTHFAQLGTIADQRLPGSGNWMHLKYQTPLQARKALAVNGKVFSSNIMIGVVPCTERTLVAEGNKENQQLQFNTSITMSPSLANTSVAAETSYSTPKTNIRSLTQAYQTTPVENQVIPQANTPKKNDSFMAKAMQHLLGV